MTTLVAVHGNGGGASRFTRMHQHIPDEVALHAITLPGFSTAPKDPSFHSLADYADSLATHLVELDKPVVLGHGIGGSIARRTRVHHRDETAQSQTSPIVSNLSAQIR